MKKLVKITLFTLLLLLATALILPILLRGKIEQIVRCEANEMLSARLDFEKLDISLLRHFPNASLELKGLTLVGQERFEGDTILTARRISLAVDLLSIFGDGGFEVSKVRVVAPAVVARKLDDGAVNWDVIKSSEEAEAESKPESKPAAFRLSVRDLRISDAAIRYEDDSTGLHFSTSPASLRLRGDLSVSKNTLDVEMEARDMRFVTAGVPFLSGAEAALDARIEADLAAGRFVFSENKLRLNAIEVALDGWIQQVGEGLRIDVKAGCDRVQFKELLSLVPAFYMRDFHNLSASGELAMSMWVKGEARGRQLPAFELKGTVKEGSFQYSSLPKAVTAIELVARIANPGGEIDKTTVDLSRFSFEMAGNSVAATLHASGLSSDPAFRAAIAGHLDLGRIREVYPLEKGVELDGQITADVKLAARMSDIDQRRYEQISATGNLVVENLGFTLEELPAIHIRRAAASITPAAMTLGECGIRVGASDLSATGQLSGYIGYALRGDPLTGRLYVKSELLDLNEIIGTTPVAQPATSTTPAQKNTPGVIEIPRNLNLTFCTELRKVLFNKLVINNLSGEMHAAAGVLSLDKLQMGLFGGKASASGSYSTADDLQHPALTMDVKLAGASFVQTFNELETAQKLVPVFAKTGGNYSLSLEVATVLDAQMTPNLQTMNASGELRSANIRIQNLATFDALATALDNESLRTIEARDVAIGFALRDGRITTQPFDLKVGGYKINLSGSTGLDRTIDYAARVSLPESATGGLLTTVAMTIGGTFTQPKITLGLREAAEEAVKNIIDKQVERLTGSKSLSEEVQRQTARLREEARKAGERLVAEADVQRTKLVEAAAAKGALAKFAAQKAGDKLVEEAQRQAEKLSAEAERQIEKLTTPREPQTATPQNQ